MGYVEIPIMPASAPATSAGIEEHKEPDKPEVSTSVLTIGPPVTVGTKRKACDATLDPMPNGAADPSNSKVPPPQPPPSPPSRPPLTPYPLSLAAKMHSFAAVA